MPDKPNTPKAPEPHADADKREQSPSEKTGITPEQQEHDSTSKGAPHSDRQEMERAFTKQKD